MTMADKSELLGTLKVKKPKHGSIRHEEYFVVLYYFEHCD